MKYNCNTYTHTYKWVVGDSGADNRGGEERDGVGESDERKMKWGRKGDYFL